MKAKIFRMNDCDYYIGRDLQSCKEHYMKETGLDEEEALEESEELSEEQLENFMFNNKEGDIDYFPKGSITFKEALKLEIEKNDRDYPYLFASSEY